MDWTIGNILTLLGLAVTVITQIVTLVYFVARMKTIQENLQEEVEELRNALKAHEAKNEIHHNEQRFLEFEKRMIEKFESVERMISNNFKTVEMMIEQIKKR